MSDVKKVKPEAELIGANGNVFNLMAIASRALKRAGQYEESKEMLERIPREAKSYDEAIQIMWEYVDIV